MASYTTDTFFNGRIQVRQNRAGYRFSIDAVLLAYQAAPRSGDKVIDLGAGCGIISLIMAYRRPDITTGHLQREKQSSARSHNCFVCRHENDGVGRDSGSGGPGCL